MCVCVCVCVSFPSKNYIVQWAKKKAIPLSLFLEQSLFVVNNISTIIEV